ncbi:MAG TPA: M23 family metallopeptidase [Opitutaceae bacterium]|nr:M23 family metallopeptidase [Opitutaceae bacterium]
MIVPRQFFPRIVRAGWAGLLITVAMVRAADRVEMVWPTPNTGWADKKPLGAYIQDTGTGEPESGTFGGVRNGGTHFHEGIDIKAVGRDRRGEPTDDVYAAVNGVVRHVSSNPGGSSYGRYIVLEHPDEKPAVYTLYAHLAKIAPGLRVGDRVTRGQTIATMGHSSGGYTIPRERSHLHFEIGVMITRDFQAWYNRRKFGSANEQGYWNGMNLMGIDPLHFFSEWRARRVDNFQDYFERLEPAVTLRIATRQTPNFIARYPSLLTKPLPLGPVAGWEIKCSWTGLPFAWTPLTAAEAADLPGNEPRIVAVNAELEKRQRSKSLAVSKRGKWSVGKDLETVLQQLFGVR